MGCAVRLVSPYEVSIYPISDVRIVIIVISNRSQINVAVVHDPEIK